MTVTKRFFTIGLGRTDPVPQDVVILSSHDTQAQAEAQAHGSVDDSFAVVLVVEGYKDIPDSE